MPKKKKPEPPKPRSWAAKALEEGQNQPQVIPNKRQSKKDKEDAKRLRDAKRETERD